MRRTTFLCLLICSMAAAVVFAGGFAQEKSISVGKVRSTASRAQSLRRQTHAAPAQRHPGQNPAKAHRGKSIAFSRAGRLRIAGKALQNSGNEDIKVTRVSGRPGWVKVRGPLREKTTEDPDAVASRFIKQHHKLFALESDLSNVRRTRSRKSLGGHHVTFEQLHRGIPVEGGKVTAHLLKDGRIHAVESRIAAALSPDVVPRVGREEAVAIAREHLNVTGPLRGEIAAALVILPEPSRGILAWKVSIPAWTPCGDWVVLVHAQEGTVLSVRDIRQFATGQGKVFDPNPVVTLQRTDLSDESDGASAVPPEAYATVTLEELDNTGYLRGPYVDTCLTPSRAFSPTLDFRYDRSEDGFEEVMIYYHIQEFRKYLRDELGFPLEIRQVLADAHTSEEDNSWYSPLVGAILFGDGGVDDAEDAYLIIHEYVHAVIFEVVREPVFSPERDAMSEGTADYFAASFYAAHAFMPETVAQWDGISNSPIGVRRVDSTKIYPADAVGEGHDDGEIWSSALWHLREAVGREVADRLVLEAMFYLDSSSQFTEGVEALLLADEALCAGAHTHAITTAFADRGIVVPSPLEFGDVRNGMLGVGDLTMGDGSYYDQYAFNATAGQVVNIALESGDFDAYLVLLDPFFNLLADSDDLPGGSRNSQIVLSIPDDGLYHILANAYSPGESGSYTLSFLAGDLSDGTPQKTSIAYGRQVSGHLGDGDFTFSGGNAYDDYTFSGHVGQKISASMTSDIMDAFLEVYDEGGNFLVRSNFGYDPRLTYTLPDDQYYTLAVSQSYPTPGDYELLLSSSDPELPIGQIVSGDLDSNDLQFTFDNSYFDPYQFESQPGQTLSFKYYSDAFDAYLIVYNPYYENILEVDDIARSNSNAVREELHLMIPGTYFVIANSFGPGETGGYRLSVAPSTVMDTDGDGFSDHIEIAENTNPLDPSSVPPDADGDVIPDAMDPDDDNDGMPDRHELIAGTDPLDPDSLFAVVSVSAEGGVLTLRWSSVPGRSYVIYRSTDLVNWSIVQQEFPSQGPDTSWTDTDPGAHPAAFYRIEVIPIVTPR